MSLIDCQVTKNGDGLSFKNYFDLIFNNVNDNKSRLQKSIAGAFSYALLAVSMLLPGPALAAVSGGRMGGKAFASKMGGAKGAMAAKAGVATKTGAAAAGAGAAGAAAKGAAAGGTTNVIVNAGVGVGTPVYGGFSPFGFSPFGFSPFGFGPTIVVGGGGGSIFADLFFFFILFSIVSFTLNWINNKD